MPPLGHESPRAVAELVARAESRVASGVPGIEFHERRREAPRQRDAVTEPALRDPVASRARQSCRRNGPGRDVAPRVEAGVARSPPPCQRRLPSERQASPFQYGSEHEKWRSSSRRRWMREVARGWPETVVSVKDGPTDARWSGAAVKGDPLTAALRPHAVGGDGDRTAFGSGARRRMIVEISAAHRRAPSAPSGERFLRRTRARRQATFAASGAGPMARNSSSRARLTSRMAARSLAAWAIWSRSRRRRRA